MYQPWFHYINWGSLKKNQETMKTKIDLVWLKKFIQDIFVGASLIS